MPSKELGCRPDPGDDVAQSRLRTLRLWLQYYHWLLLSGLAVLTVLLGYLGFRGHNLSNGVSRPPLDLIYAALQLFVLHGSPYAGKAPWTLQAARFLAPCVAAYTAIRALSAIFREQRHLIRLCYLSGHVVICGLGRRGLYLAQAFRRAGHRVTVIEKDGENDNLSYCRDHGIITLIGDCTSVWQLHKARVCNARYLLAVCGSDGTNAEVAVLARRLAERSASSRLACYVHVTNMELCRLLKEGNVGVPSSFGPRIEFFNIFETGAAAMLRMFPLTGWPGPIVGDRVHMLVVGLGQLGQNLILNAARQWHGLRTERSAKLHITVVDLHAKELVGALAMRYPDLTEFCHLLPCEMDVRDPEFEAGAFLSHPEKGRVTCTYICLDNDSLGLCAALAVSRRASMLRERIPIAVRMAERAGLATLLRTYGQKAQTPEDLSAFCLLDQTCTPGMIVGGAREIIARAIHEDYVLGERAKGNTPETNPSMVPWDLLPERLKELNRAQVAHLAERLGTFGYAIAQLTDWGADAFQFTPEEVEGMARIEHDRWCDEKHKAGCRYAAGPRTETTLPDLAPYDDLGEEAKEKDRAMVRRLPRFLATAGFQVKPIGESRESGGLLT